MSKAPANPEHERFTKALSSALSFDPERIREIRAQAKAEKPSPKARYKYDPEAAET